MWWISTLVSSAALLLLARWTLRVARPQDDLAATQRALDVVVERTHEAWTIFWRMYGPVTNDVRQKWEALRARVQRGSFGVEGT